MSSLPKFLAVEGTEGTGKSTQVDRLAYVLKEDRKLWVTKAPGGTAFGIKCREILSSQIPMVAKAEEFIHAADLAQWSAEAVYAMQQLGCWVLSDRSQWSSYAYSTYGKQNPSEWELLFRLAVREASPEHVILLTLTDLDEARRRANEKVRPGAITKYDEMPRDFYERIDKFYRKCVAEFPHIFSQVLVDGLTEDEVTHAIIETMRLRKII